MSKQTPDIFVVSYQKSGRTWLRAMIAMYLTAKYDLPIEGALETHKLTRQVGLPITFFSHNDISNEKYETGKKIILLRRGIKDTLVSNYFHRTRIAHTVSKSLPIIKFIKTHKLGIKGIINFYKSWKEKKNAFREIMEIRYEEMHDNPRYVLREVLTFMGETNIRQELIDNSVEQCTFQNLQKAEKTNLFNSPNRLKPGDRTDPESYKVRKGKIGNYTEYLSDSDIKYINNQMKENGLKEYID